MTSLLREKPEVSSYFDTPPSEKEEKAEFSEAWLVEDPLQELQDRLIRMGRFEQARLVGVILDQDREITDEALIESLVVHQLAQDWDSEEDSLYDQL